VETQILKHIPVMVEEVMMFLRCEPGKIYVDATVGCGGHAREILKRTSPDGVLIGFDWDENAILEAKNILEPFGNRVKFINKNFIYLIESLDELGIREVDGILIDLGLSSLQLEDKERGFSFMAEGPLDMRMDQRIKVTAEYLLNRLSLKELETILIEYGNERWAKRIAKAIIKQRERSPIKNTQTLKKLIHQVIPKKYHTKIDPATKTFQALRIKVNNELENLKKLLAIGWCCLKKGGRICVLSFHSLEDRLVKESFKKLESEGYLRVITKKPVVPTIEEVKRNPRARSAKLRCAERI
jgi:16S rRNA (cytosine1402-N4)-methyltransferase